MPPESGSFTFDWPSKARARCVVNETRQHRDEPPEESFTSYVLDAQREGDEYIFRTLVGDPPAPIDELPPLVLSATTGEVIWIRNGDSMRKAMMKDDRMPATGVDALVDWVKTDEGMTALYRGRRNPILEFWVGWEWTLGVVETTTSIQQTELPLVGAFEAEVLFEYHVKKTAECPNDPARQCAWLTMRMSFAPGTMAKITELTRAWVNSKEVDIKFSKFDLEKTFTLIADVHTLQPYDFVAKTRIENDISVNGKRIHAIIQKKKHETCRWLEQ